MHGLPEDVVVLIEIKRKIFVVNVKLSQLWL